MRASPVAHAVHQRLLLARGERDPGSVSRTGLTHQKVGAVVNFVVAAAYQFWYIGSRGEREATTGLLLRVAVRPGAGSRMAQGPPSRRSEDHRGRRQGRGVFLADRHAALPSAWQGLWEVRSNLTRGRIARVLSCIHDSRTVLLPAFIKKTQKTPNADRDLASKRMKEIA